MTPPRPTRTDSLSRIDTIEARPLPAERIGSSSGSQPPTPGSSRPTSLTDDLASRLKTASLTQPSRSRSPTRRHRHTPSAVPPITRSPELVEPQDPPQKYTNYLVALAAQERHVLELKEELRLAEANLTDLKRKYAHHEATARRNEIRRVHQMRPMGGMATAKGPKASQASRTTQAPKQDDVDGSSAWMYEEMERRKALMCHGPGHARTGSRRVFSGARQPKALSLLPPATAKVEKEKDFTRLLDSLDEEIQEHRPVSPHRNAARAAPEPMKQDPSRPRTSRSPDRVSPERVSEVMEVGKQLATDWRNGLWTFFEDIKQATMGDDAAQQEESGRAGLVRQNSVGKDAKRRPRAPAVRPTGINQAGFLRTTNNNISPTDGASFWKDHGIEAPKNIDERAVHRVHKKPAPHKATPKQQQHVAEDSWETWDTPPAAAAATTTTLHKRASVDRSSGGTSAGDSTRSASPSYSSPASSLEATPRPITSSVMNDGKSRESIPWPTLTKLGPAQLRRTASHLMSEWERSLTPPAEEGDKKDGARHEALQ